MEKRKQTVPIDRIYAILGLLPYGKEVKPKYKPWAEKDKYTDDDLKKALMSVMQVAVKNNFIEPLAWHGKGTGWIPEIEIKEGNVSIGIEGGVGTISPSKNATFEEDGTIKVEGYRYTIDTIRSKVRGVGEDFLVEGGAHVRDVIVETGGKLVPVTLFGTQNTLKEIEEGDELIVLDERDWETDELSAILVRRNHNIHWRIGLVEFYKKDEWEKLKGVLKREIVIGTNDSSFSEQFNEVEEERAKEKSKKAESSQSDYQIFESKVEITPPKK